MVTPLRSWIVVAASALSRRAFAVLPRRHGDAAPWLQLALTLQLFNPGLPHQGRGAGVGRGLGLGMTRTTAMDRTL